MLQLYTVTLHYVDGRVVTTRPMLKESTKKYTIDNWDRSYIAAVTIARVKEYCSRRKLRCQRSEIHIRNLATGHRQRVCGNCWLPLKEKAV